MVKLIPLLETLHSQKVIMPILLGITQQHVGLFSPRFYHYGSCGKITLWQFS